MTARLAMSLDGYIADPDGGFDRIQPDVDDHLDTSHQHDFDEYLRDLDIVVMGARCYEQGQAAEFPAKQLTLADYSVTWGKVRLKYVRRPGAAG